MFDSLMRVPFRADTRAASANERRISFIGGIFISMERCLEELYRIMQRADASLILSNVEGLSPRVRMALQFLEEGSHERAGLAQAARYVRMHRASLCRAIRNELKRNGIYLTLPDYLNRLRLNKARKLLQSDPFLLCKEIASLVGMSDRNFERVFRKYTGKTATEHRRAVY